MSPLLKTLCFLLALGAAGRLAAQTQPPGGPYHGTTTPGWTDPVHWQMEQTPPGQVLQAGYETDVPTAEAGSSESMLLPPRGRAKGTQQPGSSGDGLSMVNVGASLALVLGLFFLVAWLLRKATPGGESGTLPGEVVELLGRKVLTPKQQLQLLRCGRKLLLVSVTPEGTETLTEITDEVEVDRLAGLCRQSQPGSASATFRQVLDQFSSKQGEQSRA